MGESSTRELSAEERAAALGARVDAARAEVAVLSGQLREAEDTAHSAMVAADFETADVHRSSAADLRSRLTVAEAVLSGLTEAQKVIAHERLVEQHRASLAEAEAEFQRAFADAESLRDQIWPAIQAARDTLTEALACEAAAQRAGHRVHELRVALGAPATRYSSPDPVSSYLARRPFWRELQMVRPEV